MSVVYSHSSIITHKIHILLSSINGAMVHGTDAQSIRMHMIILEAVTPCFRVLLVHVMYTGHCHRLRLHDLKV